MPLSLLANIDFDQLETLHFNRTQIECSIESALKYDVPPSIILAIADIEGGKPGERTKNKDGSFDYGYMQINTVFLSELEKEGITEADVLADNCTSFDIASKRISNHIKNDKGDYLKKIANYHSKNEAPNSIYQSHLRPRIEKWINWQKRNGIAYSEEFDQMIANYSFTDQPSWLDPTRISPVKSTNIASTPSTKPTTMEIVAIDGVEVTKKELDRERQYFTSFNEAVKNPKISIEIKFNQN